MMSLITIFRSGPQEPRTRGPCGLGAKPSQIAARQAFSYESVWTYFFFFNLSTLFLCKCIPDTKCFQDTPLSLPPKHGRRQRPVLLGNQNGSTTDVCLHILSLSSGSFGKRPIIPGTSSSQQLYLTDLWSLKVPRTLCEPKFECC